jgi:hypothetical protein
MRNMLDSQPSQPHQTDQTEYVAPTEHPLEAYFAKNKRPRHAIGRGIPKDSELLKRQTKVSQ